MNNIAANPEYAALKKQLRQQMEAELTMQGDPRTLGHGDVFDKYECKGRSFNIIDAGRDRDAHAQDVPPTHRTARAGVRIGDPSYPTPRIMC